MSGKTVVNRDEIEKMILAVVQSADCGKDITGVTLEIERDDDGNRTFTVERLHTGGGAVLPEAMRIATAEATRLRKEFALREESL